MTRTVIRVGAARYAPVDDMDTTRAAIAAAKAAGGDYVTLRRADTTLQVLISPGMCVMVEEHPKPTPEPEGVPGAGGEVAYLIDDVDDWGL